MYRPLLATAALLIAVAAPTANAQDAAAPDANVAAARAAIKGLGEGLKEKLVNAMQNGGPVNALGVCKTEAPKVTEAQAKPGLTIGRTALKYRNSSNKPDAFETAALEKFAADIKGGADAMKLEHSAVVEENGKKVFRYMKPIMTAGKPCLACHGSELAPEVSAKIKELYPDDKATGFSAGDLRGAFTVRKVIQ